MERHTIGVVTDAVYSGDLQPLNLVQLAIKKQVANHLRRSETLARDCWLCRLGQLYIAKNSNGPKTEP